MIKKTLLTLAVACVAGVTASAAPADGATRATGGSAGRMFGYNSDFNVTNVRGLYELNTTGQADLMWYDDLVYPDGPDSFFNVVMTAGWVRNGRLCGFESNFPYVSADYIKYVEHDLETGDILLETDIPATNTDWSKFWVTAAYCPMNDRIYGFGFSKERKSFAFKSAPASNPANVTILREGIVFEEFCYGITFNTNTGELIGMRPDTSMVRINITDGTQTKIYNPGFPTGYKTDLHSLCYDASNNKYYCNYTCSDETSYEDVSYLYEIDLERNTWTRAANYNAQYQFNFLTVDGASASVADTAPAQVTDLTPAFDGDNLTGSFDFTLPEKSAGGDDLTGTVIWTIYYDHKKLQDGSGKPGEKVSVPATITKGFHTVRVQCAANGQQGLSTVIVPLLGGEQPLTPENVIMTRTEITWDAVTEGLSGSPLTSADVSYKVSINGNVVGSTKETKMDISDYMASVADKSLAAYTASVCAMVGKNESSPAESNKLLCGTPLSLPVNIAPTAAQGELTISEDSNNDNVAWEYYKSSEGQEAFLSAYVPGSDDWLFLPQFDPKGNESVKFNAIFAAADENLLGGEISVYIGTEASVDAMKTVVIPNYVINVNGEQPLQGTTLLTGDLANAKELVYGIRIINNISERCPIYLFDIDITAADSKLNGPAAVTDIKVTPNETNNKKIDVSFKLPTTTVAGTTIPADATIEALVLIDTPVSVSGKPGESVTAAVYGHQGDNLLIITPSVNGIKGAASPYVFFTGDDLPGMVTDLKVTYDETNCSMRVDFTPPTKGFYGGSLANSSFKYEVYQYDAAEEGYVFAVETPIGVNFATLDVPLGSALTQFNAGIRAVNAVGPCPELALFTGQIGTPHKLNMLEDFEGDEFLYNPLMPFSDKALTWGWQRPERLGALYAIDSDYAFTCQSSEAGITGKLELPKFSGTGFNKIELKATLWNGQNGATTKVYAEGYNVERTLVGTIECGSNNIYNEASVVLPEQFSDCPWILLSLEYEFAKANDVAILTQYSVIGNKGSVNEMQTILGSVFGQEGQIVVNGYRGEQIAVYSVDGKLMKKVEATSDNFAFPMQKGLYAVRVGNRSTKVVVR